MIRRDIRLISAFIVFTAFAPLWLRGASAQHLQQQQPQRQGFSLAANAFLDSTRVPATRVTVEVPLRHLVFFKKEGLYEARYDVYLLIFRTDVEEEPTSYVIHGDAVVKSYDETRKRELRSRTSRTFSMPPGDYEIQATLRVKQTRIAMQRSVNVTVSDFSSSGIGFGTPRVLSVASDRVRPFVRASDYNAGATEITDPALAMFDRQPAVRFELFLDDPTVGVIKCDIFYEVVSPEGGKMLYGRRQVDLRGKEDIFVISFIVDEWDPGLYKINLRATTVSDKRDATISADLRIDVTRAMLGEHFDETMGLLSLIASKEDLEPLKKATPAGRPREWSAFWKKRDPDPSTPFNEALDEHLRRVQYVQATFSKVGQGWRSDRGQVYIQFGAPQQIDTASDSRNRGEYEIWRYFDLNRTFVFYDMFGVGDYKLVEGDLF